MKKRKMNKPIIERLKCYHPRVWCMVAFVGVVLTVAVFFIVILPIELLIQNTFCAVGYYIEECRNTFTSSVRGVIKFARSGFSEIFGKWKEGRK